MELGKRNILETLTMETKFGFCGWGEGGRGGGWYTGEGETRIGTRGLGRGVNGGGGACVTSLRFIHNFLQLELVVQVV